MPAQAVPAATDGEVLDHAVTHVGGSRPNRAYQATAAVNALTDVTAGGTCANNFCVYRSLTR
jgi:hypothetical protein